MKKFLFAAACLLQVSLFAWEPLVRYPDYPKQIERDRDYDVRVSHGRRGMVLDVYNHCEKSSLADRTRGGDVNRRFCAFAFERVKVRVDIAVHEDVRCYKVFPARLGLRHEFKDGVISVWLDKPAYFGVQINDSDKSILSVFADEPERDAPKKGDPGVLYVDGWMDGPEPTGVITTDDSVKEIYIAPGAVLNARLVVKGKNTYLHGRGLILDPMSDIFRYDQIQVKARGLVSFQAPGCRADGVTLLDARTFNFMSWGKDSHYSNVKVLASMMCSDGFTNGSTGLVVDHAWLYVGDNALVVSGVQDAIYRNITIGTSCKAIFPQGTNKNVKMENIDVFRADEGVIANEYNGVLRRNNKWSEMSTDGAKREPGPQDLKHQGQEFFIDNLSAVDATYVGYVFRGRNMGALPKSFVFRNLSVPYVPGHAGWRGIGKTNGVAVAVDNDPKKWLNSSNYTFTVTNLYLGGEARTEFPAFTVKAADESVLKLDVATDPSLPRTVPLAPARVEVNWECPLRKYLDVPEPPPENLLDDSLPKSRSLWQRAPSWLVKFDAVSRDEKGNVIYRLRQCEKGAGMQAVITERVRFAGFGRYRLSFEAKAKSENPFDFRITVQSNEKRIEEKIADVERDGDWKRYEVELNLDFDPKVTDLVALKIGTSATADDVQFRNLELYRDLSQKFEQVLVD